MSKSTPEGAIKKAVFEYLSYCPEAMFWIQPNGGQYDPVRKIFRKLSGGQRKGVSDILGVWRGVAIAIEVKTAKGVMRPEQKKFQEEFKAKGGLAFVVRSVSDAVDLVASLRIVGPREESYHDRNEYNQGATFPSSLS